ncbi:P-loop NTPase fold protein [Streptomyces sp. NPDC048350]|uniref:P-loop NTPase fold protein n=1 Tax=Streptomyces sp. NPDC048350 TaxID=3365538 RepID=UPI00371ADE3C
MGEPGAAGAVWSRPADESVYQDAVRRLFREDVVLRGYLGQRYVTGIDERRLAAEFHGRWVVERVRAWGAREYDDYQSAVEQFDQAVARYERLGATRRLVTPVWLATLRMQATFLRRRWEERLPEALAAQVRPTLRRLIGEEHDDLLVTPDLLGLIEVHDPRYVVPHRELQGLAARMALMAGGTIAISGPRGVGKSTLLKSVTRNWEPGHLVVPVEIPAAYVPQEFLLSLFQRVCEEFLALHGHAVDSSSMFLVKLRKHLLKRLRHLALLSVRLLVAGTLLVIALAPLADMLREGMAGAPGERLAQAWHGLWGFVTAFWSDHPVSTRLPLGLFGLVLLVSLPRWQKRSSLVKSCVHYLYLLRTMQSTSVASGAVLTPLTAGTLSATRTTTLSSRTLTFPELVGHFRGLLERMTKEGNRRAETGDSPRRVLIVIDEIDRIGTAEQARSLLTEIKSVFGIPHVYFLISVAEDVGAGFVRRGIPVRDVIDSSLDDVVHIEPRTLDESNEIIQNRVPGLTLPFVALAHCLSGGITRDLIRCTRRMVMIPEQLGPGEGRLRRIAGMLLIEELRETLAGFRVLMGSAESSPDWAARLDEIRSTILRLRPRPYDVNNANDANNPNDAEAPRPDDGHDAVRAREAVQRLFDAATAAGASAGTGGPDDCYGHWDELTAYSDFVLTLIDFFTGREEFPAAAVIRSAGPDGDLQRLAEARLELGVSPAGARLLLERFRKAWNIPGVGAVG